MTGDPIQVRDFSGKQAFQNALAFALAQPVQGTSSRKKTSDLAAQKALAAAENAPDVQQVGKVDWQVRIRLDLDGFDRVQVFRKVIKPSTMIFEYVRGAPPPNVRVAKSAPKAAATTRSGGVGKILRLRPV